MTGEEMNRAAVPVDSTDCADMHVTEVAEEDEREKRDRKRR